MRNVNPTENYVLHWSGCHRHPARRARGRCDLCGFDYCLPCLSPQHTCAALPAPLSPWPSRALAGSVTVAGLAALWILTLPSSGPLPGGDESPQSKVEPSRVESPNRHVETPLHSPQGPLATVIGVPAEPAVEPPVDEPPSAKADNAGELFTSAPPAQTRAQPAAKVAPALPPPAAPVVAVKAGPEKPQMVLSSYDRGSTRRRAVLLTLDAGSHADGAEAILDALAAAGIRTTLFITGEFIQNHPHLVLRMIADGHEVGNHTETHLHLTRWEELGRHETRQDVTRERLVGELTRTHEAFRALTGLNMAPYWRAPYGEHNKEIRSWAAAAGWRHVGWTPRMDTLDWVTDTESRLYRDADEIAERLLQFPSRDRHQANGAIILMHLGSERPAEERLGRVLPRVLNGYRQQGFEFVTASAMLQESS